GYSTGTELMRHAQNETARRTGTIAAVGGRYHIRPAPADADSDLCPLCTRRSAMNRLLRLPVALPLIALAACYHATIDTGLLPPRRVLPRSPYRRGLRPMSARPRCSARPNSPLRLAVPCSSSSEHARGRQNERGQPDSAPVLVTGGPSRVG